MKRRVVITGAGVVSPAGIGKELLMERVLSGESCFQQLSTFDTSEFPIKLVAPIPDFDPRLHFQSG